MCNTFGFHSGHKGQIFQTESMVEICSESLVRAIGKVLLIKIQLKHQLKPIKLIKNGLCL